MKNKIVCGILIGTLVMTGVTGCGTGTTTEVSSETSVEANTFAYTDGTEEELVSTTVMGRVDSVDGNEVTLSIGGGMGMGQGAAPEMPSGDNAGSAPEMPSGDNAGSAPEMPDGDSTEAAPEMPSGDNTGSAPEMPSGDSTEAAPEMPSGDNTGNAPEIPSGDGQSMEAATALLTINDESVIEVAGTDGTTSAGSLSDITEGSMLQITFDENGEITAISISSGMGGDMAMGGGQSSGVDSYDAVIEYAEDTTVDGETYSSTGTDGTVYIKGTSSYTITVVSYSDSADLSGAATADSFSNHEAVKPDELV